VSRATASSPVGAVLKTAGNTLSSIAPSGSQSAAGSVTRVVASVAHALPVADVAGASSSTTTVSGAVAAVGAATPRPTGGESGRPVVRRGNASPPSTLSPPPAAPSAAPVSSTPVTTTSTVAPASGAARFAASAPIRLTPADVPGPTRAGALESARALGVASSAGLLSGARPTVASPTRTGARPTVGSPSPAQPAPLLPGGAPTSASASAGLALTLLGLATLLLLGAPPATRRLRLASEPRRPAPFVLIPVPPG
jgi:hypothetical protein